MIINGFHTWRIFAGALSWAVSIHWGGAIVPEAKMRNGGRKQLSLDLEGDTAKRLSGPDLPNREDLYFAVLPEPDAAAAAAELGEMLRTRYDLIGKPYASDRLHISLNFVASMADLREDVVFAAMRAGSCVQMAPFKLSFDRLMSFGTGPNGAVVLRCDEGSAELKRLHALLNAAMRDSGLRLFVKPNLTPHMTLIRGPNAITETVLEHPIRWTVRDFVLVHSAFGRSRHTHLDRWPLLGED
jgi:2'-5' RNA ligase